MNELSPLTSANQMARRGASQATMVEQSRAIAEVQAAVVVAQQQPRNKQSALAEMREVCQITELAERAFFRFNRGGGPVNGESVHLARELARIWGNMTSGIVELSRDDIKGQSEMMAFAWDLQTNARQQTTFIVPHLRDTKNGAKPLIDMRDIYENNANMGARRLREMIFSVLPVWFREEAAAICRETLENGGGKPLIQRIADCVAAFESIGVTKAQIERKQGRRIDDLTSEDVATLGVVYKSIRRGEMTKDDEFPREIIEAETGDKLSGIEKQIAANAEDAKKETVKVEDPPPSESPPDPDETRALGLMQDFQRATNRRELDACKSSAVKTWLDRIKREKPEIAKRMEEAFDRRAADFG